MWIVKNTWGQTWGHAGSFYIPIGKNSFCIEQQATIVLSNFFDDRLGDSLFKRTNYFYTDYRLSRYLDSGRDNLMTNDLGIECLVNNNC